MSESRALAVHRPAAPVAIAPSMTFHDMIDMGEQLVRTGFLPAHLRTGAQVAAVILTGRELGMEPMRAVRSLSLVKGRVVESADSQLARFKADGGRAQFQTLTETEAVLFLRHPNGDEHTESFTMADARNAGLAGSETYKKFPKAMLRSRVITAGLKSLGWEGAVGAYDPEELQGTPLDTGRTVAPDADPHGRADDIGPATVLESDAPTEKQAALLERLLRSHVFTDKERRAVAKKVTTKEQAKAAIDWATAAIAERKAAEAAEAAEAAASDAAGPDDITEADVELLDGSQPIAA